MVSKEPQTLTPAARSAALWVARIIFYNGLLMGSSCGAVAVGVFFFHMYHLPTQVEICLVGAVFIGLTVMSFGFAAMANTRIAKLKNAS